MLLFAQIILNSLVTGTQVLLLAAALYLTHTVARFHHIALGAAATAAAYSFMALGWTGAPFWLAATGGVTAAAALNLSLFALLRKYIINGQPLVAMLASLTAGTALEALLGILFGPEGRFLTNGILPTYNWQGLYLTQVGSWTIMIGIATAILAYIFLQLLPWGRLLRAVAQHPPCTAMMGVNEQKIQRLVFILAGLLAGTVGLLTGLNNAVTPQAGLSPVITAFIALLVGGVHDFRGTVLASFLLVLIPEILVSVGGGANSLSMTWKMVFVFLLALLMLLARPRGVFSTNHRQS